MKAVRGIRTSLLRERERMAFSAVIETYEHAKSVLGTAKAMDYSKITGGRGAQYSDNSFSSRLIEFMVDVENLINNNISKDDARLWLKDVMDIEATTIHECVLRIRERIGRAFIGNQVYPVSFYFRDYRCKK